MKYPPIFKRVPMKNEENNIAKIQHEFEVFYKKISQLTDKSPEKTLAMRKLQEACFFLTRSVALEHFDSGVDEPKKTIYSAKDEKPISNKPTIVLKRKKI